MQTSVAGVMTDLLCADGTAAAVTVNRTSASVLSGVTNRNPTLILKNTDAGLVASTASAIDFQTNLGVVAASIVTQYSQSGGGGDGGNLIFATEPNAGGLRAVGNVDNTGRWFLGPSGATVSHVVNGGMAVSSTDNSSNQIFDVRNTGAGTSSTNIGMGIGLVGEGAATGPIFIEFYDSAGAASRRGSISASGTSVLYNTTSDARLKNDIKDFTGALDLLAKVRPRSFVWKETGKQDYGFIAQELKLVYPGAVSGEPDSKMPTMAIDYGKMTPLIAAALKDEIAKELALEARVAALEDLLKTSKSKDDK
jgi:hypothetical protein